MPQQRCRPEEIIAARLFSAASFFTDSASEGQHSYPHPRTRRRYLPWPGRGIRSGRPVYSPSSLGRSSELARRRGGDPLRLPSVLLGRLTSTLTRQAGPNGRMNDGAQRAAVHALDARRQN
jgi:hypothetical protein